MSSLDEGPRDESTRRLGPASNEIPVGLTLSVVLARTDDVALALVAARVYSTCLSFDLVARARYSLIDATGHALGDLAWGHGPFASSTGLLVGVEFSDGRRASNLSRPDGSSAVVLHPLGGSGGDVEADQSWWLSPLPPEGLLRVVVRCPVIGIAETSSSRWSASAGHRGSAPDAGRRPRFRR